MRPSNHVALALYGALSLLSGIPANEAAAQQLSPVNQADTVLYYPLFFAGES